MLTNANKICLKAFRFLVFCFFGGGNMQITLSVNVDRLLRLMCGPAARNDAHTEGKTAVGWEENGMSHEKAERNEVGTD